MQSYMTINGENNELTENQERMRRNLRYHFMNPKEKWQAKGTLPIKMILIIIKLIILTVQLIVFSENNSNEVSFVEGSKTSFKHLFLINWSSGYETLPYPPSSGPFAIYKINEFFESASFALENYYKLETEAIGPYGFGSTDKPQMSLCISFYSVGEIFPFNSTYNFSNDVKTNCIDLKPLKFENKSVSYDVKAYLENMNFTINFNGFLKAEIKFSLRSIQLKSYEMDRIPDCFQFDIIITYDNNNHNGQVMVDLQVKMQELLCSSSKPSNVNGSPINRFFKAVDIMALFFSIISFILCCRSIYRLYTFWQKVREFFLIDFQIDVSNKRRHFFSVSYMLIFFGDILIISGTIIKLHMDSQTFTKGITNFTLCNYFLGIGVFFGYLTLMRYFSYFPKSSILINTIRASMPPLLRFSLCSIILYLAFALLGWIILGPYHLKFRSFVSSISCLFSLMNGDDMYVTLSIINIKNNTVAFVFCQIFVYMFCLLFIFVVLNLILTIIIEAYNNVVLLQQRPDLSYPQTDIFWNFINSCPESSKSPLYRSDMIYDKSLRKQRSPNWSRKFVDTFCCCIGKGGHTNEINIIISHDDEDQDQLTQNFYRPERISDSLERLNRHICISSPRTNYGSMVVNQRSRSPDPRVSPQIQHKSRSHACSL